MDNSISIAKDFSITPGSRFPEEGMYSGKEFREDFLTPKFEECLKNNCKLQVVMDGTIGYGTSFLEEVFGGLAREFGKKNVLETLTFISIEEEYLISDIKDYINDVN